MQISLSRASGYKNDYDPYSLQYLGLPIFSGLVFVALYLNLPQILSGIKLVSGIVNTKVQCPVRGINPHRAESKCGFPEYGPSDLFN